MPDLQRTRRIASAALLLAMLGTLAAFGWSRDGRVAPQDNTLAADTAAGVILDREGAAARKPVLADRWGLAEARTRVELGDWLKTGSRGANALHVRLAGGAELLLGPGARIEVVDAERVRLASGELRVTAPEKNPLVVAGPGDSEVRVTGRRVVRAIDRGLETLESDPRWLTGYETQTSTEALGSLLANVDGRDLPLTIGYHKVSVDIRDQIARTVIEESFLNHTSTILEGVFYFPLPADASISGFGMWIGDELVQGDIVEKERAREIYETILRERRDPGLLEWTGGNIFKARVFPIGAEKRIRIAYTQVLPKEGDTYAYHYALQSELLRQHPLAKLQIQVDVASTEELVDVQSPSHECRVRATEHAARVEFDAEEYAPDRDFELRLRTAQAGWKVTAVSHRRADEGYFMLLLDAPPPGDPAGDPDAAAPTAPLDVLVLADTSGSMWGPAREAQLAFIDALLGALTERDTLQLLTCDAAVRSAFPRPRFVEGSARTEALAFLEAREPLGWSNLDAAFAAAFEAAGPRTQIIYVGDGQPTAGDADPIAVAHRLERAWPGRGRCHAVVPGTRSEPAVLRALASLGGGSVRSIGGGSDPAATAFALLHEITAPALRDLALEFDGVSVAAVYPERLPNLPLGTQQVVVGRFDPSLGDAAGSVTLTGTLDGAPVSVVANLELAEVDEGNSFIPRLWARRHLDHLLDQGDAAEVRERVLALSEDFQIITPYTSFLVLESDADRERFQVERRFRMRDGEDFFAEGREQGRHDLLRAQMAAAKTWRKNLRAQVLARLADMDRELTELLRGGPSQPAGWGGGLGTVTRSSGAFRAFGPGSSGPASGPWGGGAQEFYRGPADTVAWDAPDSNEQAGEWYEEGDSFAGDEDLDRLAATEEAHAPAGRELSEASAERGGRLRQLRRDSTSKRASLDSRLLGKSSLSSLGYLGGEYGQTGYGYGYYGYDPFDALIPQVPGPRVESPDAPYPDWPAPVRALVERLDRRAVIAAGRGFDVRVSTTTSDARGRVQVYGGESWLGADRWVVRSSTLPGHLGSLQWVVDDERGHLTTGWDLGRTRTRVEGDRTAWTAPFAWHFGDSFRSYAAYEATLSPGEDGTVLLTLRLESQPDAALVLAIDSARALVLEQRWVVKDEVTQTLTFRGFHEAGGAWWPAEMESRSRDNAAFTVTRLEVEALDDGELARRVDDVLAVRAGAILLGDPEPEVAAAKQAVQDGTAGIDERWRLLRHFGSTQRWELAAPHLAALENLAAGKRGLVPIRATWLQQSRRNEELRAFLTDVARELAETTRSTDYGEALQALNWTGNLDARGELLDLLDLLGPVFQRRTDVLDAALVWDQRVQQALANMGRAEDAHAKLEEMVAAYPTQLWVLTTWANARGSRGEVDEALAFLAERERNGGPWLDHEVAQLRRTGAQLLWSAYRLEDFIETLEAWQREDPARLDASLLNQYLTGLIFLDREERARERIHAWLTEYRRPKLAPEENARVQAAIQVALGNGTGFYHTRYEDETAALLAETALAYSFIEGAEYLASQVVYHYSFRQTDAGLALQAALYARLESELGSLPVSRVVHLASSLRSAMFATDAGEDGWQRIFDRIYARWLVTETRVERDALAGLVLAHGRRELVLRHHRHVLEHAVGELETAAAASQLFHALLAGPWSVAVQDELVALLPRVAVPLPDDPEPGGPKPGDAARDANVAARVLAFYDLVSWLPLERARAAVAALPDVNSLPRRRLAVAWDEALRDARLAAAELLAGLRTAPEALAAELAPWVTLERAYLLVKARRDLDAARNATQELLERLAAQYGSADEDDIPLRDRIVAARAAATLVHLLVRADGLTRAEHEAEFLTFLDANLARESKLLDWRELKYTLLVALDRVDALGAALAEWTGDGSEFALLRWGRDRAHLLAEVGELDSAVELLRGIEETDELSHLDYRALADWLTALDRRDAAHEARIASWSVLDEYTLGNALSNDTRVYQRSGDEVPPDLDPEIPIRFAALMRKATRPGNWVWTLQSVYAPTQDFRLLECIPEAVLGASASRIYPFLGATVNLADTIQEEASVDRLRARLAELRETRAETDVDRRALALLEFMVVQRATRQAHGTEIHAERALAALKSAFDGEWSRGETPLMAQFLYERGAVEPAALGAEQLRQLAELRRVTEQADDRFLVTAYLAGTRWNHGKRDDAIRTLQSALADYRDGDGRVAAAAQHWLVTLSGWFEAVGAYRDAEALWRNELDAGYDRNRELWSRQRLFEVYRNAVLARADVSIGADDELYPAVRDRILADLAERTNENHVQQVVSILCDLWRRGHERLKQEEVPADARRFAFTTLPGVLSLYQYRGGQNLVGYTADCLAEVSASPVALEFLVVRAENEPRWLRLASQDFWTQHAWRLSGQRIRAKSLPTGLEDRVLEDRVLELVLAELREELRTRQTRDRRMFDTRHGEFWREKRADFIRVALEHLAERGETSASVAHAAEYLFRGLDAWEEALEALRRAHARGLLEIEARATFAGFLQERSRFAESLPVVAELVEARPGEMNYRVLEMRGQHGMGRSAEAALALERAVAWCRANERWNEGEIATLATACLETALLPACAKLYDEAIALHVKTAPDRGVGDGTLSFYYRQVALAHSGLGNVDAAVDAAAGAIVSWGRSTRERSNELASLEQVLAAAEDLDAYVERLDATTEREGVENPIVRKALGKVYLQREAPRKAAVQLRRALEGQPNDLETYPLLVRALAEFGARREAADALLAWARAAGSDVQHYARLGEALAALELDDEAERAFTTIVELLPNESESHRALAEIRQGQDRWGDAVPHWRHVVRVRSQEPEGHVGLARALIRLKRWDEARAAVGELLSRDWPKRFGDVAETGRGLLREIPGAR